MASTAASESTSSIGPLEDVGVVAPEIVSDVVRSDADGEIRLQAEQKAERLDAAGNVDRLAVAIGEVDGPVHDDAAACAKRSKAARAERTTSSSASSSAWASRTARYCGQKCRPVPWPRKSVVPEISGSLHVFTVRSR